MRIIYNKFIPFRGYKAINLFGIVFAKKFLNKVDINHESIHTAQMKELLFVGFYIWYLIEWLILLIKYRGFKQAYKNIRFEKEAYLHEKDLQYLNKRIKYNYLCCNTQQREQYS